MKEIPLFTNNGATSKKTVSLDETIFGLEIKDKKLLKEAYLSHSAQLRTAHPTVLDRGEVRGGGKKPWRQKGTGRSRHGSIRSPIWRGGGVTFGPTANKNYDRGISKKAKRLAVRQALSMALDNGRLSVIESFDFKKPNTAEARKLLDTMQLERSSCLVVVSEKTTNICLSFRNIPGIKVADSRYLNVYDLLSYRSILLEGKSLENLSQRLGTEEAKK
jgi:large subunit ribosomal protein L4